LKAILDAGPWFTVRFTELLTCDPEIFAETVTAPAAVPVKVVV
jgi:hypothetical protein